HLMAVTNRHVAALEDARAEELAEAMTLVQRAVAALSAEYHAEGFNLGLNQGRVAGAGIEGHLHMPVVPRRGGGRHFGSVVGDTRVLPEELTTTWDRLRSRVACTEAPPASTRR